MKYPYERFLRFLVSRRADVNAKLERYGLPRVGDLWIARARGSIRRSAPYALVTYIDSKNDELGARDGILEWAHTEGFRVLWEFQPEFGGIESIELRCAFRIFVHAYARSLCGMLLLAESDDDEICSTLQDKCDITATPTALSLYRRVFWDVSLPSPEDWQVLLGQLAEEERHLIGTGISADTLDDVRDAADIPINLDHQVVINDLLTSAYRQFKRAMASPHPESAGALKWYDACLKAWTASKNDMRELEKNKDPSTANIDSLFSVQISKSKHISLSELRGTVASHDAKKDAKKEGA